MTDLELLALVVDAMEIVRRGAHLCEYEASDDDSVANYRTCCRQWLAKAGEMTKV